MKVRIVKHTEGRFSWYKNQIGSIFNVDGVAPDFFILDSRNEFAAGILKSDCEILPEEKQPEPFDLERALKGEKVITGDGDEGVFMFTNPNSYDGDKHLFQFSIKNSDNKYVLVFNGLYWEGGFNGSKHHSPVFMAPRESEYVTKWVAVFNDMSRVDSRLFENREDVTYAIPCAIHVPITFKRPK